jgi:uncharacterized protein (DUF2236 family)
VSLSVMPDAIRRGYGIAWNARREAGMRRLAAASRRLRPVLPDALWRVPHARQAERRARLRGTTSRPTP